VTKTGHVLTVGELAREYGFTDLDGTQPEPWGLPTAAAPARSAARRATWWSVTGFASTR
jgi:hypothetical protein